MMPQRSLATVPAGRTQATPASGRKQEHLVRACGPMRRHSSLYGLLSAVLCVLALAFAMPASAQQNAPAAPAAGPVGAGLAGNGQAGAGQAGAARPASAPPVPAWRRTDNYRFPAMADTVRRLQFAAQAMQLREYCADRRVPDDFVRERLQHFGRLTGRDETCTTLADY
jgi:hypothetical protein